MNDKPRDVLKGVLLERIHGNPRYSLRAFARQLKLSHSYLSQVLSGQRGLSATQAFQIAKVLNFDEARTKDFVFGVGSDQNQKISRSSNTQNERCENSNLVLEMDRFRAVSEWYHGAIVELTEVEGFKPTYRFIASRLGISAKQAKEAVSRLIRLGVLKSEDGNYVKTHNHIFVPTTHAELAIRKFHEQAMDKAKVAMTQTSKNDFVLRDITGMTLAINPKNIPEAKRKLAAFRKSMRNCLSKGPATEVYQMNIQLFPVSIKKNKKKEINYDA